MAAVFSLGFSLLQLFVFVQADYRLEINVVDYEDSSSCTEPCQYEIIFCPFTIFNGMTFCWVKYMYETNSNNIIRRKPFVFNNTGNWTGQLQLEIQINTSREFLAEITIMEDLIPSKRFSDPVDYSERTVSIELSFLVSCVNNYHGPHCATFCEERDDELGHFTCDGEGNKVCLQGYKNLTTNCTDNCTEQDDCYYVCSPVCQNGGTCEGNKCECADSYDGSNCSVETKQGPPAALIGAVVSTVVLLIVVAVLCSLLVLLLLRKIRRERQVQVNTVKDDIERPMPGENPVYSESAPAKTALSPPPPYQLNLNDQASNTLSPPSCHETDFKNPLYGPQATAYEVPVHVST